MAVPDCDSSFPGIGRLFNNRWKKQFQEHRYICRKSSSSSPPSILIGDSLAKNFSRGKSSLLFEQYFKNFLNLGIGGDHISNVIYRVKNNGIPKVVQDVVLLVGTNNISANQSPIAIAEAIMQLKEATESSCFVRGTIYVSAILHRLDEFSHRVPMVNAELKQLCHRSSIVYVEHPQFSPSSYCHDGLHLNHHGYELLGNSFLSSPQHKSVVIEDKPIAARPEKQIVDVQQFNVIEEEILKMPTEKLHKLRLPPIYSGCRRKRKKYTACPIKPMQIVVNSASEQELLDISSHGSEHVDVESVNFHFSGVVFYILAFLLLFSLKPYLNKPRDDVIQNVSTNLYFPFVYRNLYFPFVYHFLSICIVYVCKICPLLIGMFTLLLFKCTWKVTTSMGSWKRTNTKQTKTTKPSFLPISIVVMILVNFSFQMISFFGESKFSCVKNAGMPHTQFQFQFVPQKVLKRVLLMQYTKKGKLKPDYYLFIRLILSGNVEPHPGPTNNEVMDWLAQEKKQTGVDVSEKDAWEKFAVHFSYISDLCNPLSFGNKLTRLKKQVEKYGNRKSLSAKKENFLSAEFEMPKKKSELEYSVNRESKLVVQNLALKDENHLLKVDCNQLKRKVSLNADLEAEYQNELENVKKLRKDLTCEIQTKKLAQTDLVIMKTRFFTIKKALDKALSKVKDLQLENSSLGTDNLHRKAEDNVSINILDDRVKYLQDKLDKTNCNIDDLKLDKQRLRNNVNKLHKKLRICKGKDINKLEKEYETLLNDFLDLEKERRELAQLIDIVNSEEVVTFQNGKFTNEIRRAVMELVSLNVSINKISDVIRAVLSTLTNTNTSELRLPSDGCRKKIVEEALILAQLQVVEAMIENENEGFGNCLHGDGTTKYSRHYQNFQVTTKSGRCLSFGLSEVADSDAEATLKSFITAVEDVCEVVGGDKEKQFADLITSIKNTMSDQGPVNPLFNSKLKILRSELTPKVIENWEL